MERTTRRRHGPAPDVQRETVGWRPSIYITSLASQPESLNRLRGGGWRCYLMTIRKSSRRKNEDFRAEARRVDRILAAWPGAFSVLPILAAAVAGACVLMACITGGAA